MDQNKVDQILQGQKELDVTQKKITEALKDLRRKANVNISRTDDILKKKMLDTFIDINDVFLVVDDRNKAVNMWRDLGLNTFQVAPGDF